MEKQKINNEMEKTTKQKSKTTLIIATGCHFLAALCFGAIYFVENEKNSLYLILSGMLILSSIGFLFLVKKIENKLKNPNPESNDVNNN